MHHSLLPGLVASAALSLTALAATPATTHASEVFSQSEVSIVVPWSPGGRTDVGTRLWAPYLESELGKPVVVLNRPGGGGMVGVRDLLSMDDGHAIGAFSLSQILSQWTKVPPLDMSQYKPVAMPFSLPFVLVVDKDAPWQDAAEFVAYAQDQRVTFGVSGSGTSGHIAAATLASVSDIEARFAPYDGDAGAVTALLGKEVEAVTAPMVSVVQQVEAGELRALGVSLEHGDELHEGIPTFKEQGIDFVLGDFGGALYLPATVSDEFVEEWEQVLERTFADPELQQRLADMYIQTDFVGAGELEALVEEWNPHFEQLVEDLGLRLAP